MGQRWKDEKPGQILPGTEPPGGALVASPLPGRRFTGPKRRLAPVALVPAGPAR